MKLNPVTLFKNSIIPFAVLLPSLSFGGSINLDSRADFESKINNDTAKAAGDRDYSRFQLQTLRLDMKGDFKEDLSYRLRFRLNNGSLGQRNQRDNLNSAVDYAYIQPKLSENLSFQLGKFTTDIGGVEGLTPGSDLYFTSQAYQEENPLRYSTGAKLLLNFANQEIQLMATNQQTDADADDTSSDGFQQNRNALGVVYKASLMDKNLSPILSYHEDHVQSTSSDPVDGIALEDKKFSYATAGLKWDFLPFFLEADYHFNQYKNKSEPDETDKTSAVVATLGARWEQWTTKLKHEISDVETATGVGTSTTTKHNTSQLAFEYHPTSEEDFRYHLAYVHQDIKPENADRSQTQTMIAGFRLYADFLK